MVHAGPVGRGRRDRGRIVNGGVSIGMLIAAVLSWTANHSFGWAFVHGLCSWFYVAYYLLTEHL